VAYSGSWKGFLKLGFVTCAVKLTPATTAADQVRFHLINPETGNRIKMAPQDAETGEPVDRKTLVKGYEHEKGHYILFDNAELDKLKIESSHTIDIARFVPVAEIDRRYFENPYYLVPDGKVALEPFRVIQEAINQETLIGIATLVLANRERVVAIEPRDRGMIVTTLRSPDELRDYAPLFSEIDDKPLDKYMIKLAKQLIGQMTGAFDPAMFQDRYQAALRELVSAKLNGVKPKVPKPAATAEVVNLFEALKKSVAETGKRPAAPQRAAARRGAGKRVVKFPKRGGKRRLKQAS
jgi:DNA end-binding protein Ku